MLCILRVCWMRRGVGGLSVGELYFCGLLFSFLCLFEVRVYLDCGVCCIYVLRVLDISCFPVF